MLRGRARTSTKTARGSLGSWPPHCCPPPFHSAPPFHLPPVHPASVARTCVAGLLSRSGWPRHHYSVGSSTYLHESRYSRLLGPERLKSCVENWVHRGVGQSACSYVARSHAAWGVMVSGALQYAPSPVISLHPLYECTHNHMPHTCPLHAPTIEGQLTGVSRPIAHITPGSPRIGTSHKIRWWHGGHPDWNPHARLTEMLQKKITIKGKGAPILD